MRSHDVTHAQPTADLFYQTARDAAIDQLHAATSLYTTDPIVLRLLDRISWPAGEGALLDTSCGDGAFLGRALERLLAHVPAISDDDIAARLLAYEIHFFAAAEARSRIKHVLVGHGRPAAHAERVAARVVRCGDFLTQGPPRGGFRAIVGNPPYLRMLNVPNPLRAEYHAVVPAYARADLLHSFLDRCATLLAPDGELALVTADRWLFNESAAHLREVVGRYFGLAHVERLDCASAFYRPKLRCAGTPPRIHPVAVVLKTHQHPVRLIDHTPIYPDDANPCATQTAPRLGEVATVRVAPWLGTPGIFLVDQDRCRDWPAGSTVPAIDTDDIHSGVLQSPRRCAICTHPDATPPAAILAHLDRELPRMCTRGRATIPWMPPEPFHRLDLTVPSLLVPRISRTVRPIRVPAGILPVNHNLTIVRAGTLSLEELESVLASEATQTGPRGLKTATTRSRRACCAHYPCRVRSAHRCALSTVFATPGGLCECLHCACASRLVLFGSARAVACRSVRSSV